MTQALHTLTPAHSAIASENSKLAQDGGGQRAPRMLCATAHLTCTGSSSRKDEDAARRHPTTPTTNEAEPTCGRVTNLGPRAVSLLQAHALGSCASTSPANQRALGPRSPVGGHGQLRREG